MAAPLEDETLTMDDIMRRWPAAIGPILRHRLLCVGCPVAAFHSLDDAIRAHGITGTALRADLAAAIRGPGVTDPP